MGIGSNDLALLFRLKAQNEASPVIKTAQADITRLSASSSTQFGQMQNVATTALGRVTQSLAQVSSQTPVVGTALNGLGGSFTTVGSGATAAAAGLAGVAGAAIIGAQVIGAAITGVIALGKAIFDLTKSAADAGAEIFDLSQKTNFTAETLSALKIEADLSNGSIESVASSLTIFQSNMVKAAEGNEKLAKTFKDLKIDTTDQETAFRQATKALFEMGETEQQSATAKELFGKASKDLLAIIKSTNGSIDEAIDKYEELGLIIDSKTAAAADQFGDTLDTVNKQLIGLSRVIGFEVMPVLTVFFNDVSIALTQSRGEWSTWGATLQDIIAGLIAQMYAFKAAASGSLVTAPTTFLETFFKEKGRILNEVRQAQIGFETAGGGFLGARGRSGAGGGGGKGGGGSKQDLQFKTDIEESNRITAAQIEDARTLSVALKQAYDLNIVNLEDYYRKRQILIDDNFNTEIDAINREQEALDAALARGRIKKEDAAKKDAELTLRTTKARNKLEEETNQLQIDRQKALDQAELNRERQLAAIRVAVREGELARIEQLVERHAALESSLLTVRLQQEKEAHDEQMLLLDIELKQLTTSAERKAELDNKKIESEQRYTDRIKQLTRERIDALNEEAAASGPSRVENPNLTTLGTTIEEQVGPPPWMIDTTDAFGSLGQAMSNVLGLGQEFGQFFGDTLSGVFSKLAVAVGDAVHAFVLFGNAGGGVRKFAATVIAEIARMAAIQAIWELAQGVAMLALNFFWPDPKLAASATAHFHAAAIYGGMAAVAAGAGRLVAGGAFQQGGGSGGTGAGNRGRNPSDRSASSADIAPIESDRRSFNSVQSQPVVQTLEFRVKGGVVVDEFAQDYMLNGRTRLIIKNDGQG